MRKIITFLLISSCAFSSTYKEIKDSGVFKVGIRTGAEIFAKDSGDGITFSGFEVDLAKKIAKTIFGDNIKVEFIPTPAKERFNWLDNNKIDIMMGVTKSKKREKSSELSIPYFLSAISLVSKKEADIQKKSDIINRPIGVIAGTSNEKFLDESGITNQKVACISNDECLEKLKNNEIVGMIGNNLVMAQYPLKDDQFVRPIKSISTLSYVCIAMQKGNTSLRHNIDDAIVKLSKSNFFQNEFNSVLSPYYNGTVDKKYLLLDSLYKTLY